MLIIRRCVCCCVHACGGGCICGDRNGFRPPMSAPGTPSDHSDVGSGVSSLALRIAGSLVIWPMRVTSPTVWCAYVLYMLRPAVHATAARVHGASLTASGQLPVGIHQTSSTSTSQRPVQRVICPPLTKIGRRAVVWSNAFLRIGSWLGGAEGSGTVIMDVDEQTIGAGLDVQNGRCSNT